jgi:hypothetical protein
MKKCLISFVFTLIVAASMNAQKTPGYVPLASFNKDTLQYLITNFEKQKDKYIGKPIGMIFNDLELEIKGQSRINQSPRNKNYFAGVILYLYNVDLRGKLSLEQKRTFYSEKKNYGLYIETVQPINWLDYITILRQANVGIHWSNNMKTFYAPFIVKSISTNATP